MIFYFLFKHIKLEADSTTTLKPINRSGKKYVSMIPLRFVLHNI